MALILEIRDRRGTTMFHPVNGVPITVGRALSNDIILDDPYVDAHHVRITPGDAGVLTVEDLGSVNGVIANGARSTTSLAANVGLELKIGRTTLRFRDRDEAVPAAVAESGNQLPPVAQWAMGRAGSFVIFLGTIGLVALITWLGNTERSGGSTVLAAAIGSWMLIAVWAGIWTASTRGADRTWHAREHFTIACLGVVLLMLFTVLGEWLVFFFPDVSLLTFASAVAFLTVTVGAIVGHLAVAGATRERRLRVAVSTVVVVLLITVVAALVRDDKFSDTPKFQAQIKAINPAVVPTHTVDDFVRAMAEARASVDKAAAR